MNPAGNWYEWRSDQACTLPGCHNKPGADLL
jgi:hypothetical protein